MDQVNKENNIDIQFLPLSETAVLVEFGKSISPEINSKVKSLGEYLERNSFPGMIEYVSAFSSVTVFYNPLVVMKNCKQAIGLKYSMAHQIVTGILKEAVGKLGSSFKSNPKVVEIPVCYGGEFGPDLPYVAEQNKLNIDEVIEIHSSGEYLVYMIGFAPGFPYLGGMSERIAAPRRQSPRTAIPARSVGIAGMQTGIYPITTPGGWQLIGSTPVELFRPTEDPPSLLQAGDIVRFRPISLKEYEKLREGKQ
ncbi:5-oxoprolinase subunit PxpB [Dendrosporobacter sp. 1207_IL3150]|uniref:5-oxoprolinase subunit PxpB n=1 Tax=Dendrosporobacter sp. 1207_IL3150 TaxID=3084054 RepID=UPI002FDADF73